MSKIKEKIEELIDIYQDKNIIENPQISKSEEILQKAKDGKIDAIMELGYNLMWKNNADSIMCFEIASTNELYKYTLYYELGCLYYNCKENYDLDKAKYYFKEASNLGNPYAKYYLGKIYFYNNPDKIIRISEAAFDYLKEAYESGCDEARWLLANCYRYGKGTQKNIDIAKELYEAVDRYDKIGLMYWEIDDYENTILYLNKCIDTEYFDTYIKLVLADSYARYNKLEESLNIFNSILSNEDTKAELLDFFDDYPFILEELKEIFGYDDVIS